MSYSGNKLVFQKSEEAKKAITDSAKKEISSLYSKWSDELGKKAEYYKTKTNSSAWLQEQNVRQLQAQLKESSEQINKELSGIIKNSIYLVSDSVVQANNDWLIKLGFPVTGVESAFSSVPDQTVRRLVTGQIYDSGWSLSKSIWGDSDKTMKELYTIVAQGLAQNLSVYDISKMLEGYVDPSRAKQWNLKMLDGVNIYRKSVDYNAQRLVRTLAQHGYQTSFIAVTENNPFVLDYIWRANGSRVCALCMDRDGQHFPKDNLPLDHPNGMCVMEPNVDKNMPDKLADWINSPDGTFKEIDAFAENFGYKAFPVKTVDDFKNKYGVSSLGPTAYFSKFNSIQKMEFEKIKFLSGATNNKQFYIQNFYSGDGSNLGKAKKFYDALHGVVSDETKLKEAEKYLASLPNTTLSGVWKNEVKLSDYQQLKDSGSIQKKLDYYESKLFDPKNIYNPNYSKWEKYYDALNDYINKGEKYVNAMKAVEDLKSKIGITTIPQPINKNVSGSSFSPDKYTALAKANSNRFTSKNEADKFHRPFLDSVWRKMSKNEQYSVWEYTQNSNPINKSLSGYHDSWSRSSFLGLGKTELGHENPWRKFSTKTFEKDFGTNGHKDYKMVVQNLTNAIEKSELPYSCYLVRGSDNSGFAGLLEGNLFKFEDAKKLVDDGDLTKIKSAFEGQVFQNHSFMSTGIAEGTGFGGSVAYRIYAPEGTKGIYAEPTSYFGDTVGMKEKLYRAGQYYHTVGDEAEVILQRGTSFRITNIDKSGGKYVVDMEIIDQPNYFKSGLEYTHTNGVGEYKK